VTIILVCLGVLVPAVFFFACGYAVRYCTERIAECEAKLAELDPEGVYREFYR
jgi:hypothetical protein